MSPVDQQSQRAHAALPQGLPALWLLLFALWLVFNASLAPAIVLAGVLAATVLGWIFATRSAVWNGVRLTPTTLYHFLAYTGVFLVEMVKANLSMLRYVYAPRIHIQPGIVRINLRLRSPIGRLALANSIALTPGSLVMDIGEDALFIHWLDVRTTDPEQATEMIAGAFDRHLGKVFG